jgi:hypothetical protein
MHTACSVLHQNEHEAAGNQHTMPDLTEVPLVVCCSVTSQYMIHGTQCHAPCTVNSYSFFWIDPMGGMCT